MAINTYNLPCDGIPTKSISSTISSNGGNASRLKFNLATDDSLTSTTTKSGKVKRNNTKSPYFASDKVQLLSRVTEKRLVRKKTTDFVSSFPLAANIYKANSDEFKSPRKANKKVRKSVLTIPNDPAPMPQVCTVSDMNESEYCNQTDEDRKQKVIKKRIPIQNKRKARVREKNFEFYDRDAQYCSQLNINLDSSSTDMIKNFNGDGTSIKKKTTPNNKAQTASNNLNDVWAVLRNMNKFQFRPSPPMSDESNVPKKNKIKKRRPNHKDLQRVIETRTEEFAYISSYELDKSPVNYSPSSSIDRITVIDKQNEFSKICEEFEKRLLTTHNFLKDSNNNKTRFIKNKSKNTKNNVRALGFKENKQIVPLRKKKKHHFKTADEKSKSGQTNSTIGNKETLIINGQNSPFHDHSDLLLREPALNDSVFPIRGSSTYSDNSGSSKAELKDKKISAKVDCPEHSVESPIQLNGISKVILSKGQEANTTAIVPKRFATQKRKPRLVTTMPSSNMMPKLTQTEVKRRLAHIRFPIVVLGKEQVSSNVEVVNYDQFSGLEDHIWPFMVPWTDKGTLQHEHSKHTNASRKNKYNSNSSDSNSSKSQKLTTGLVTIEQSPTNDKKQLNNDSSTVKKKNEIKRLTPCPDLNEKLLHENKKQKSIIHLKDKMLNFLYKKSSSRSVNNVQCEQTKSKTCIDGYKIDTALDTPINPAMLMKDLPKKRHVPLSPLRNTSKKTQSYNKYPWAKAKWASDFIENVIKKIRSGVYYSQDHKVVIRKYQNDYKEASVQAGSLCDSSDYTQTCDSDTDVTREVAVSGSQSNLLCIPGFNNMLPMFEIKTLNMKQIAVKHCVTNVMLQFDITVPTKDEQSVNNTTKSLPLIPLEVTESHTKVYKCKTTILNAMLPAELCSILPKMINHLNDSNAHSNVPLSLSPVKTISCLSTISETPRENPESVSLTPSHHVSTEFTNIIFEGTFTNIMSIVKNPIAKIPFYVDYVGYEMATELLPKGMWNKLCQYEMNYFISEVNMHETHHPCNISSGESPKPLAGIQVTEIKPSVCSALESYKGGDNRLCSAFKPYDFISMVESLIKNHHLQINLNLTSYFNILKLQYDGKNMKINMSMTNNKGVEKKILVTVSDLKIDSLYKALPKVNYKRNKLERKDPPLKCIEYINNSIAKKSDNGEVTQVVKNKTKRKGYYRLYKKCKSTTNIPLGEKCLNTALNKIINLDDFFQILGSQKILSTVFDGYAAKKILSSIAEMKNWITEINPKQALLILLLTNKKDTPNLVRFRPILLQGIAVNRITRATELDMEIEVIERENLNKFSHYEGISYLPESVTNYDNLLEELYWIAKTTASDYQRPFEESSQRLLKSLLEKRKKLNPSYLRVMARYVGLGLLKSPMKN